MGSRFPHVQAIEQATPQEAGKLGFMARALVQSTIPHSDPKKPHFERTNGLTTLTIIGNPKIGIPYGSMPRLLLAWICSEAVKTKSPVLEINLSQSAFLTSLGMHNNGTYIKRLDNQSRRLFSSLISITQCDQRAFQVDNILIAQKAVLFWDKTSEKSVWGGEITLTSDFYNNIIDSPVPIDLRVIQALKKSPLAMDIYAWLVYRIFLLNVKGKPFVKIPWASLMAQFGSSYGEHGATANSSQRKVLDFKRKFKLRLKEVLLFYPSALNCLEDSQAYLIIKPARLHLNQKIQIQ